MISANSEPIRSPFRWKKYHVDLYRCLFRFPIFLYIYIYTHIVRDSRLESIGDWRIQESKDCNEFPKSNYPLMSSSNDRSVTKVRLNWSLIWRALKYFGCWLYEIRLHLTRRNAVSRLIVNRSVNQTTN